MPGTRRLPAALAAVASAAALAACGSSGGGEIPEADANQLLSQLDAVESAVLQGDCTTATTAATTFALQVSELPADTFSDSNVHSKLVEASANLVNLVPDQCEQGTTGASGETGAVEQTETPPAESTPSTPTEPEPTAPTEDPAGQGKSDKAPGHNKDKPAKSGDAGGSSGGIGSDE